MRLLIIDKTAGLKASDERHRALGGQPGVELHVAGPVNWLEAGRAVCWEPNSDLQYTAHPCNIVAKGHYARAFYVWGLQRAIREAQPDLIQLLEEPWALSSMQVAHLAGETPLLFYTWENIYRDFKYPARLAPIYARIDRRLHRQAKAAVCATEGARDVLLRKGFEKPATVIPYGIPEPFFENPKTDTESQESFTIGYVGRMMAMKGVDLLLRAASRLPDCRVALVGSCEDEGLIARTMAELGMESRVAHVPAVPESEVADCLKQMDVLVLPSRTTPGWQEQLGRVLIEAMAVGVPTIGSDSGAIPEVLGDAGLIFKEDDVDDLYAKLEQVRQDSDLRVRLSVEGRRRARERFTWERFAESLTGFYRELGLM